MEKVRSWSVAVLVATLVTAGVGCRPEEASVVVPAPAAPIDAPLGTSPLAALPVHVVNDNGGWCWFQGRRVLATGSGLVLLGSTASSSGAGGQLRGGDVEVAAFDPVTARTVRVDRLATGLRSDDHNSPGLVELPSGQVVAGWAAHNENRLKHWARTRSANPASGWSVGPSNARGVQTSYANLLRLRLENGGRGRLYDFYRGEYGGHNVMISDDDGVTWRYGGTLVASRPAYQTNPYVRYAVRGNRIHFIASTSNPQNVRGSSVGAGYLEGGVIYNSFGRRIGTLADGGVDVRDLTLIQAGSGTVENRDTDVWIADLVVDAHGRPTAVLTVKSPRGSTPVPGRGFGQEHRIATFDGTRWTSRHLAWGGSELFDTQPSYSGLAVIDPADPARVYLSSNVHPVTGAAQPSAADGRHHWELYEARTRGDQAPTITAITRDSTVDNIRPVVARGGGTWILAWMRGTYTTYTDYRTEIVAMVSRTGGSATGADGPILFGR